MDEFITQIKRKYNKQAQRICYVDSSFGNYSIDELYPINGPLIPEEATKFDNSWEKPYRYLQNAINEANNGTYILVKTGIYYPTHIVNKITYSSGDCRTINAGFSRIENKGIKVYGGCFGNETAINQIQLDNSGFAIYETIISGDIWHEAIIDENIIYGDRRLEESKNRCSNTLFNSGGVDLRYFSFKYAKNILDTYCTGVDAGLSLTTMMSCKFYDITGCVTNRTIDTCEISYCSQNTNTNPKLQGLIVLNKSVQSKNSTIHHCLAISGGCLACENTSIDKITLHDCIAKNQLTAGILLLGTSTASNITSYNWTADHSSIDIRGTYSKLNAGLIYNCTTYSGGAGIVITTGAEAKNLKVYNCSSQLFGGGILSYGTIKDCEVHHCVAGTNGGGIYGSASATGSIIDTLVYCNVALDGGGTSYGNYYNSIIFNNYAVNSGGGQWSMVRSSNCLVFNNIGNEALITSNAWTHSLMLNSIIINNTRKDNSKVSYTGTEFDASHMHISSNIITDVSPSINSNYIVENQLVNSSLIDYSLKLPTFIGLTTIDGTVDTNIVTEKELEIDDFIKNLKINLTPLKTSVLYRRGIEFINREVPDGSDVVEINVASDDFYKSSRITPYDLGPIICI